MIRTVANGLLRLSSLKSVCVFLLLMVFTNVLINGKPYGLAQLSDISHGASIPDMEMSGYSPERVYEILTAQGEVGRAFYLHYIVPQDFPFPLFYALFLATALTCLARSLFPAHAQLHWIGLVGLCAGLADWMENLCLLGVLLRYPKRMDAMATLASGFTVLKATFMMLSLCAVLVGTGWVVVRYAVAKVRLRA
jgi:hypothetical protein